MINRIIKTSLFTVLLIICLSTTCFAQLKKYTNYSEAKIEAEQQNKDILLVLTGAEWCKPCIKMKKNVFSEQEFIDFANEKFIVFEINLIMPVDIGSENYKEYKFFQEKYKANALPTLILIDTKETVKLLLGENLTSLNKTMKNLKEIYTE